MKLPFGLEINFGKEKGRKPKSRRLLSGFLPMWSWGRELYPDSNFSSQLETYRNQWVYTASNRNAQTVASVPIRLYTAKENKNIKTRFRTKEINPTLLDNILSRSHISNLSKIKSAANIEEVIEHPILDLMSQVNPFANGFDLWETTQLHQELTGNAYWFIINNGLGKPAEIWLIPPDRIKIIPSKENFIFGYLYEYGNFKQVIPENMIIHFKMPNPNNLYYGLSPIMSATMTYKISKMMDEYQIAVFENRGQLSGAFETDDALDPEEFDRLKEEIREAFVGHKKSGATPLLEHGVSYTRYGSTLDELSFKDGKLEIKETILNVYGQNISLYSENATRSNSDAAQVMYARQAIKPRLARLEQKLNEKFIPKWQEKGKLFLAFDDCVPEDEKTAATIRAERVRTGQISIDEAREQMRMLPYPNGLGSEPLFQQQYFPLSAIVNGDTLKQANNSQQINGNKNIEQIAEKLAPLIAKKIKDKDRQQNNS